MARLQPDFGAMSKPPAAKGSFLSSMRSLGRGVMASIGRTIDTVLSVAAPSAALRRHCDRERYFALTAFDAARRDRTTSDWDLEQLSPDQAVIPEMGDMNARARGAVRNDWAGKSIISAYQRNVVGTGIVPMAAAVDSTGKPRSKFNKQADKLWRRWSRNPRLVDSEKTKSFNAMMRLAISEWVATGNAFIVKNYQRRREGPGLSYTMLEVEQLADAGECQPRAGNEMRGGVECRADTGEAVAYWFYESHPYETVAFPGMRLRGGEKPKRIEADRVLHLHRQTRPGETLSPSRLSASLFKMHGQKRYDDNEQFAKGLEAFLGFAIKRDSSLGVGGQLGFNPLPGESVGTNGDGKDAGGNRQINFEPGLMPVLYRGEEIQMFNPQRPGAHYGDYTDRQVGMIAAGAELSYPMVSRDYSKGNFSGQRQGRLDDEKLFDIDQQDLEDMVVRRVWCDFIEVCVEEGRLQAPGFMLPGGVVNEDWTECTLQPPPRPWVDPAKEAAAAKIAIDYRLSNRGRILQGQGISWRTNFEEIAEQSAMAEGLDIKLPEEAEMEAMAAGGSGGSGGSGGAPKVSPSEPKPRGKAAKPRSMSEALAQAYERGRNHGGAAKRRDSVNEALVAAALNDRD